MYEKQKRRKLVKIVVFENAKWLKFDKDSDSVFVRHRFSLATKKNVTLRIIGLGFFRFWINGKTVTNNWFNQLFTNYGKRDFDNHLFPMQDNMQYRIYYSEYDVTDAVKNGENLLTAIVGNGWFRRSDRYCEGDFSFSQNLQFVFEIVADGQVVACSNEDTLYHDTHILSSTLYNGEIQDFSFAIKDWQKLNFQPNDWKRAQVIQAPPVPLYKCTCESDKIVKTYSPKKIFSGAEYDIYDCGKNTTGFLKFVSSCAQEKVRLEYAEERCGNDIVSVYRDLENFEQAQTEEYRHVPKGQNCQTQFTWYGFRYVKVIGKVRKVRVCVLNSGLERKTSFESSDTVLNWYYDASMQSMESNIHMGIQMDCPHRERYGYTGDGQVSCDTVMLNYGAKAFYEKWLGDIADSQDAKTGYVQYTAPYMGGSGGSAWGIAIVLIPWKYYQVYGDKEILRKYISNMRAYLQFLADSIRDGLVRKPQVAYAWLGDWSYPDKRVVLPVEFVATYYFIKGVSVYRKICKELGELDEEFLAESYNSCRNAFVDSYYDRESGDFFAGKCGANAFAIDIGLGDERTLQNLCVRYEQQGCLDTGIFGTKILMDVLGENRKENLIYKLLSSTKYPSFGHWKERGATSLWEDWSGNFFTLDDKVRSSLNHSMFAASQKHLFESLLGISYEKNLFVVSPRRIDGLKRLKGTVRRGDDDYVCVKVETSLQSTKIKIRKGKRCNLVIRLDGNEEVLYGNSKKIVIKNQ